jgi:hypothetical protein
MSHKARKVKHKDSLFNIVLRVKGSMKNEIIDAAEKHGMPLSKYVLYCVWEHMRSERGIPAPGSAQFTIPDTRTELEAYIRGESVLMPCGKRSCDMNIIEFQGMEFCDTCNVRVT